MRSSGQSINSTYGGAVDSNDFLGWDCWLWELVVRAEFSHHKNLYYVCTRTGLHADRFPRELATMGILRDFMVHEQAIRGNRPR